MHRDDPAAPASGRPGLDPDWRTQPPNGEIGGHANAWTEHTSYPRLTGTIEEDVFRRPLTEALEGLEGVPFLETDLRPATGRNDPEFERCEDPRRNYASDR